MDKKIAIRELNNHVRSLEGVYHRNEEFWQTICKIFPQFIHEGRAYKVVLCEKNCLSQDMLLQAGRSWSLNKEGIWNFLTLGEWYELEEDLGFYLIEAEIYGFCISNLAKYLKYEEHDLILELPDIAIREEEVVLVNNHKIISKKWTTAKKFKKNL